MTDYGFADQGRRPPADADPARRAAGSPPPGRTEIVANVAAVLNRAGCRWAWQGPADAAAQWVTRRDHHDLDIWYDPAGAGDDPLPALRAALPCADVAAADDPRRLRHTTLSVETPTGPAVVDLTRGDLRVGPILLVPADEIDVDPVGCRLTGAAAVADLLIRPVLRGRLPAPQRLAEARVAWTATAFEHRARLRRGLERELGPVLTAALVAVAAGAPAPADLLRRARGRLIARSLAPGNVGATWAQRRTVLPAGRARGPLGLRTRAVVVALVGTDGAGKSTVAAELAARLYRYGLTPRTAYFGMARGNLPGVELARRLLGVGGTTAPAHPPSDPPDRSAPDHPRLRRLAAWLYAGEYLWRYLRTVAPARAHRRVVIADRWIYDLRESPWPGSAAARFAERVLPAPDVLLLPDAPIELIHDRKPERSLAHHRAQQERFRRLLGEHPARYADLVLDTSGRTADPLAAAVSAVVEAAHGVRRRGR